MGDEGRALLALNPTPVLIIPSADRWEARAEPPLPNPTTRRSASATALSLAPLIAQRAASVPSVDLGVLCDSKERRTQLAPSLAATGLADAKRLP